MLSAGLFLLGGCSVDRSGLGPPRSFVTTDGVGGDSAVGAGSGGARGVGGATGSGGERGEGGATGSGGGAGGEGGGAAGARGTGGAGDAGGTGGLAGGSGGLAGGTGGLTDGTGGVIDGTGGFISGSGGVIGGTGGFIFGSGGVFGGSGGRGFSCGACTPCQRCNAGVCVLDPTSMWKMTCVSARVAATRPQGSTWDPLTSPPGPDGPEPDPVCSLRMGPNTVARTSVKMDTFDPVWNESIAPASRLAADFLMSQSSPWSIYVGDDDPMSFSGVETICQVAPQLSAADFASGTVTFTNVASCLDLVIGIQCAQ